MKFLVLAALLACAAAAPRMVLPRLPLNLLLKGNVRLVPQIVGGDVAAKGEIPWQISMQSISAFGNSHFCGASLYSENWIISASHCVDGSHANKIMLVAGEHDLTKADGDEQELPVEKIIMHPDYNAKTTVNDVSLLKTKIPAVLNTLVKTIPLIAQGEILAEGTLTTVTGWGTLHSGDSNLPALLHKVDVPVVGDAKCRDAYGIQDITDSMLCAGLDAGGKDSCQGDSGGPLFTKEPLALVGIVSWGYGCADPGYPGVYTEVSYFTNWIEQTIASN